MAIVIKKRVSLEFLGNKDDYLEFKSIPMKDYEGLMTKLESVQGDNKKAIPFILEILTSYFIGGRYDEQDVAKEDLTEFDQETAITCFQKLTGQLDPKAEGQSTTPSSTPPVPAPQS